MRQSLFIFDLYLQRDFIECVYMRGMSMIPSKQSESVRRRKSEQKASEQSLTNLRKLNDLIGKLEDRDTQQIAYSTLLYATSTVRIQRLLLWLPWTNIGSRFILIEMWFHQLNILTSLKWWHLLKRTRWESEGRTCVDMLRFSWHFPIESSTRIHSPYDAVSFSCSL